MVFLFQRYLTYYKAQLFEHINSCLHNKLIICYGKPPFGGSSISDTKTRLFKETILKNNWFGGESAIWQSFWKPFSEYGRPQVVILEASLRILSLLPAIIYCRLRNIPIILWGHAGSRSRNIVVSNNYKDIFYRWLVKISDAFICYTNGDKKKLSNVVEDKKLFIAVNTLDTNELFSIRRSLEKKDKNQLKSELGLRSINYLCLLGRLIPEKYPIDALSILKILQEQQQNIGLIIIGDGPEKSVMEEMVFSQGLKDVHILGAIMELKKSAPYIFSSDTIINPGYVGLSVNQGLCLGVPTITRSGLPHSPEIDFIKEARTGFISNDHKVTSFVQPIKTVINNREKFYQDSVSFAENNLDMKFCIQGVSDAINYVTTSS